MRPVALLLVLLASAGASAQTLVPAGATWTYVPGRSEPSAPVEAWRAIGFDDSAWSRGPSGIGYGDGDDATVLPDMQGNYASVYMRHRFTVADPAAIAGLRLLIDYDDGFVAYLNGTEVARRGLEGDPVPHDELAWDHEAGEPESIPLSDAARLLVAGANVLAIQVHDSSLNSTDLSCEPVLEALPHDPASRGPYLQAARPDAVVVRWRTRLPSTSRVEWGDPALLERITESLVPATEHEVSLTGLRPGTRYGYRISGNGVARSETLTFWTLPRVSGSGFDVAVLGNSGTGEPAEHQIGRRIRESRPELILHAGDAVFPDGRDAHFDAQVFAPLGEAMAGAALHPAAGEVDVIAGGAAWRSNFTTFGNNPDGSETWYSFDVGSVHVTVLDAQSPLGAGSNQDSWLRADLSASLACWKFVVIHAPLVTSTADFNDPANQALRAALSPIFEQQGVDVVITSHVGAWERSHPISAGAPTLQSQDPAYADPPPIYVVTGGGGRPLEPAVAGGWIARAINEHHFLRVRVDSDLLTLAAISASATTLDEATIAKTCPLDADGDGVPNAADNCPGVGNAGQANADGDSWGDACEPDSDADGIPDDADSCPFAHDPLQSDLDGDGLGDACEHDDDGDGVNDADDDCPLVADPAQADLDGDGLGDACDDDEDGDAIADAIDNCPRDANPGQSDHDGDGAGNACDADDDDDSIPDTVDNCPWVVNPAQQDLDGDAEGDHCDVDDDGDGVADRSDDCPRVPDPLQEDLDGDGLGDACESDQDGDGVAIGEDCDDRNPGIGGVPEAARRLRVRRSSGGLRLTWDAPLFSDTESQVAGGLLADLRADRSPSRASCEATLAGNTLVFPRPPEDRWWLVRFANACSAGTWDQPVLDASSPCP